MVVARFRGCSAMVASRKVSSDRRGRVRSALPTSAEICKRDGEVSRTGIVSLQLMKGLAMRRTVKQMHPPAPFPHVTGANTQSQLSLTLGASFHRCARFVDGPIS